MSKEVQKRFIHVVFTPSGKRGMVALGISVLDAARQLGVDLDSVCGGRGICGRCACIPGFGDFPKHQLSTKLEHLSAVSAVEDRYRGKRHLPTDWRLGCSTRLLNDMIIDVPESSQRHRQVIRKDAADIEVQLNTSVRLYYVVVPPADLHNPSGDFQRLKTTLQLEWGFSTICCDLENIRVVQQALAENENGITVALWRDPDTWSSGKSFKECEKLHLIGAWAKFVDRIYGAAIDLGSTTMSLHLCDFTDGAVVSSSGMMNPQIRYGEDLMSRVSYAMMNAAGAAQMTQAVREGLDKLLIEAAEKAKIDLSLIMDIILVGNPVMHHLLLGFDPIPLGGTPFALATNEGLSFRARDIDLSLHPNCRCYVLPCIAGHVGADAAAVILAERPFEEEALTLLIDVGTNAEIVLGNKNRLLACSSPTGPALEGAQISCGQRAAPGAIERIRIDRETFEPRYSVIGVDIWSDEEGFEEAVAKIGGVTGICGSGIIEIIGEMRLSGLVRADGVIDGRLNEKTVRLVEDERTFSYIVREGARELRITQADIRAIQLAKAALYAGVRLLQDRLGESSRIERIRLAGAFGSHIDTIYAMLLGLFPDTPPEQVSSAKNAAGTGARIALLNVENRALIDQVVRNVEKIETAVEPAFQKHFISAMSIPHLNDNFDHLWSVLSKPTEHFGALETPRRGRRRRDRQHREG